MGQPEEPTTTPAPPAEPYVNRFELTIVAELDVVKAQPSQDEESP